MNSRRGRREDRAVKKCQSLVTATEPCRQRRQDSPAATYLCQKRLGLNDPRMLLRRGDHSNDLIVHFLNQVSRLLDCDSAQDSKAEGYRCQMRDSVRDSVMEHLHLNYWLSPTCFPQVETAQGLANIRAAAKKRWGKVRAGKR